MDAIPPQTLHELARGCIEQHINFQELAALTATQEAERAVLEKIVSRLPS